MAELLFITPDELIKQTAVSANVDVDRCLDIIHGEQIDVIEPLLGSELYDKISADLITATPVNPTGNLTGLYKTLFVDFVKPVLKFMSAAVIIETISYTVDNGGIYVHQAENEIVPERKEIENFANRYRVKADVYKQRFYKWICKNDIPEYKTYQDEVNASKDVGQTAGWFFGSSQDLDKWGERANCSKNCNCLNRCDGCIS